MFVISTTEHSQRLVLDVYTRSLARTVDVVWLRQRREVVETAQATEVEISRNASRGDSEYEPVQLVQEIH